MPMQSSRDIFTVSRLNIEVKAALEGSFPLLWVTGEISNLATPRSGHLYFTLKESGAQVRCAMFRSRRNLSRFQAKDGMQVIVRARVTLYEPRGDYQLIIDHMEQAGEGLLRQQIEQLQQKLDLEGLFSSDHKQPLPLFPQRIGVITSASGAAVHDVLTVLQRRCPAIPVIVYPVAVQGENAAAEIIEMLRIAEQRQECDLLILTRGGGSLEDMMAFNDEQLVREVYRLSIPLISAIGHEIDISLSDHVADRRAPTPSAAAELASPDCRELNRKTDSLAGQIMRIQQNQLMQLAQRIDELSIRLTQQHPGSRLQQQQRQLQTLQQRLKKSMRHRIEILQSSHKNLLLRLIGHSPVQQLRHSRQRLDNLGARLQQRMQERLQHSHQQLGGITRELNAISPLATLERGYAITLDSRNSVVTDASLLSIDDRVRIRLAKGELGCRVEEVTR
ncbi:MAG: exodeoxyribonuclease VII large subunit [Pseudomonadota bacterium]|nr:exodeoxyribonuclease VII large subunit [Pseudomonadota bacterium]